MKSNLYLGITLLSFVLLFSCNNEKAADTKEVKVLSKNEMKASIQSMKDSMVLMSKEETKIDNIHHIELINRLVGFYKAYPDDIYSAECLNETQMIYSMLEAYDYAAKYSDTIIEKYPKYEGRALVLEGQGSNYDIFITPRDSAMVRKYYSILLNEYPDLETEKRNGIRKRLEKNHLTFDEYIVEAIGDLK